MNGLNRTQVQWLEQQEMEFRKRYSLLDFADDNKSMEMLDEVERISKIAKDDKLVRKWFSMVLTEYERKWTLLDDGIKHGKGA